MSILKLTQMCIRDSPADPLRSRDCMAQRVVLIEKNQAYLNQQDR